MAASSSSPSRDFGPVRQFLTVVGTDVRRLATSRKAWALLVVHLIPVVSALIYVLFKDVDGLTMFSQIIETVTLPFLVPLTAIFFGGPVIVEEMEGRTLTYLTLRPVGKSTLFVAKVCSGIAAALPLVLLPMVALFVICLSQSGDMGATTQALGKNVLAATMGTITYASIFATLGAAFSSSLLASIIYFVTFEMVFAALPVLELVAMRFHLRTLAGFSAGDRLGILDKLVLEEPIVFDWWVGLLVTAAVSTIAIAAGAWIFRHRQYKV